MNLAIPIFNNFISPRMDCTRDFTLLEIVDGVVATREKLSVPSLHPLQIGYYLKSRGVDVLVCGGIPFPLLHVIQQQGISVIYGIIGEVEEVLEAFIEGRLRSNLNFCFERRCGRGHGGRGPARHRGLGRGKGKGLDS